MRFIKDTDNEGGDHKAQKPELPAHATDLDTPVCKCYIQNKAFYKTEKCLSSQ